MCSSLKNKKKTIIKVVVTSSTIALFCYFSVNFSNLNVNLFTYLQIQGILFSNLKLYNF